ncbi:hypothetical protein LSH36_39g03016 [Paralvinella palmiformis]|uniref:Complexin n=1 Tax=Paralvinella palmiformis TaxID=53620 RepID=A0AAD9K8K2_9ANNE|nr:hypothetical protein LSH36_39g03016 [Paralvinella palmiformis]
MNLGIKAITSTGPLAKVKKFFSDDVVRALGDKDDEKKDEKGDEEEEDPEIAAARREAEERRAEKHRRMEEERETMRQQIRDKYGIKKKEEKPEEEVVDFGRIGRKKKTPAEMAAEMNAEEDDEFSNSVFPKNLDEFKTKVTELPSTVMTSMSEATEKCSLQ